MSIDATLQRIERKLKQLEKLNTPKPKWVRASEVMRVTGWTAEEMRRARQHEEIDYMYLPDNTFKYDLNSLHPLQIKKT
jgi:hypothetical protein